MTKLLSQLLNAREPLFAISLQELERASGGQSVDVRLTGEIIQVCYQKMRELGLDPSDTTAQELYSGLKSLIGVHDEFLAQKIGIQDRTDIAEVIPKVISCIDQLEIPRQTWAVKPSVMKRLFKAQTPKKVMKELNYRSLESMLKREPVAEIMAASIVLESDTWRHAFYKRYAMLKSTDFESRPIEIVVVSNPKWSDVAIEYVKQRRHSMLQLKELGAIVILPLPFSKMRGPTITVLPMLVHSINEIRLSSSLLKVHQVRPSFGEAVADTMLKQSNRHAIMAGQDVHWRVIHRYFGKAGEAEHPEIFEPHLQPEDLLWRRAEEVLYKLEPALHFWYSLDYIGYSNEIRPVSFNMIDMALNYANDLPFGQQAVHHFRDSLWNEIYLRYIAQKPLEQHVLRQLTNQIIEPEMSIL